jgi:hypothetical protein
MLMSHRNVAPMTREYFPIRLVTATGAISCLAAVFCFGAPHPAQSQSQGFTFALIGDLGYLPNEEPWLANVLADLNRNASLAFVVHVGDLSSPRYACTDKLLALRLEQFRASAHPFIYTPGDNEWTDCHEGQGVKGGNPLERLATVRKLFFDDEQSLGQQKIPLTRQSQDPALANTARIFDGIWAA